MRVAIIIPSGTLVHANFAIALAAMVARLDNTEIALINPKSSLVASSRNRGVKSALETTPDYILFLDSDMSFPQDTLDRLMPPTRTSLAAITYAKPAARVVSRSAWRR